jgi:hypothetical protein
MKLDSKGNEILQQIGNKSFGKYDLVVCDEMSMVNEELFDYINKEVMFSSSTKFIFMGDRNQLNPVGETESPTFKIKNKIYLTEIIRQKVGNPILELCSEIRTNIENKTFNIPKLETKTNDDGSIGIHVMDIKDMLHVVSHLFTDEKYNDNPDMCRIVAWRNSTVELFNNTIQKIRYPNLQTPFAVGEYIVFNKPLLDISTRKDFKYGQALIDGWDKVLCTTESEAVVESIAEVSPFIFEPTKEQINKDFIFTPYLVRRLMVTVKLPDKTKQTFAIPADKNELQNLFNFITKCIETNSYGINWRIYYIIQKYFTDVRPIYCVTSHKSQGSTFTHTFVNAKDIFLNRNKEEALRSFYVSCSRASDNLIITL